jgi:carbamoyl-phosphate synthase large subunit
VGVDADGFAAGSILCDEFCVVNKVSNREDFVKDIKRLLERFNIDVVLPNVDEELIIFAEEGLKSIISPPTTINICLNKYLFYKELKDHVKMPKTILASHKFDSLDCKSIAKPTFGRGSRGIYIFPDYHSSTFYENSYYIFGNENYIVQEYIEGKELTVDVLIGKEDRIFIAPRYRIGTYGGVSQVGRTTIHNKTIKTSLGICRKLDFYGPINIQFIEEEKTKDLYLIEVNPRLSGGIGITYANGANIPEMAVRDFFGEPYAFPKLKEDIVFRYLVEGKDEKNKNRDS